MDPRIITGAASLSLSGGQAEFRYLLKRYSTVAHDAVVDNKEGVLHAVGFALRTSISWDAC
jgi:phosphatidylinositol 4-kinase A